MSPSPDNTVMWVDMELTLPEVATVLGKSERQVRYLITTGRLEARKDTGRWAIDSKDLPLTAEQRAALSKRIDTARQAFEKGLEPAAKAADGEAKKRRYSVTDLEVFRNGEVIYRELCGVEEGGQQARQRLFDALNLVTRGCHSFHPADKATRLSEAREAAATAVTHLLLEITGDITRCRALAQRIEQELIPGLSALIAVHEKRSRRARFDPFAKLAGKG